MEHTQPNIRTPRPVTHDERGMGHVDIDFFLPDKTAMYNEQTHKCEEILNELLANIIQMTEDEIKAFVEVSSCDEGLAHIPENCNRKIQFFADWVKSSFF